MKSADSRDREIAQVIPADAGGAVDPDWILKMRAYMRQFEKTREVHWTKRGRKAWEQ